MGHRRSGCAKLKALGKRIQKENVEITLLALKTIPVPTDIVEVSCVPGIRTVAVVVGGRQVSRVLVQKVFQEGGIQTSDSPFMIGTAQLIQWFANGKRNIVISSDVISTSTSCDTTPPLANTATHSLNTGDKVEVYGYEKGFQYSWARGTVLSSTGDHAHVQFVDFFSDNDVLIDANLKYDMVRPEPPPQLNSLAHDQLQTGTKIDIMLDDVWWEAIVVRRNHARTFSDNKVIELKQHTRIRKSRTYSHTHGWSAQ